MTLVSMHINKYGMQPVSRKALNGILSRKPEEWNNLANNSVIEIDQCLVNMKEISLVYHYHIDFKQKILRLIAS